jgi:SagB-type dehydrogenase family enzyme
MFGRTEEMNGMTILRSRSFGRVGKWAALTIVLAAFVALCPGQYIRQGGPATGGRRNPPRAGRTPLKVIQLPEVRLTGPISLEEALVKRRSVRQFKSEPLNYSQIGQLAWAGQGITERDRGLRTAPSAGETYPIDLYFAIGDGLFVYRPRDHSLEQILGQDIRAELAAAGGMQESLVSAACDIVVAGSVRKLTPRFREHARQYMLLEAGHIAQNIQLQAVSLELGSVTVGGFEAREVSRVCKLPRTLEPLYIIPVGYPAGQAPTETEQEKQGTEQQAQATVRSKTAVLIISAHDFRDEELFETQRVLEAAGVRTTIASTTTGIIRGQLGGMVEARIPLNQLKVDDYDAIVFVGGLGTSEYFENPIALRIARDAAAKGKILAAISVAPTILANAGVLSRIRATSFFSERPILERAGATYTGVPVERDRLIITAAGPMAANQFGRAIVDALAGR